LVRRLSVLRGLLMLREDEGGGQSEGVFHGTKEDMRRKKAKGPQAEKAHRINGI
jgi:hypothetical protein